MVDKLLEILEWREEQRGSAEFQPLIPSQQKQMENLKLPPKGNLDHLEDNDAFEVRS